MDTKTGDIFDADARKRLRELFEEGADLDAQLLQMKVEPTVKQLKRTPVHPAAIGRVGRNDACPCGSGKKFKFCCLNT